MMNRTTLTACVIACLIAPTFGGCYLARDGRALEAQMRTLEARQSELSSTFQGERERIESLLGAAESEIATLNAALEEAQSMLNRNNAGLGVQVDGIADQVAELRGLLETSQFNTQQLQQELELLRMDIEIQLNAILSGPQ